MLPSSWPRSFRFGEDTEPSDVLDPTVPVKALVRTAAEADAGEEEEEGEGQQSRF
jgi:hypothetical protein